MTTPCHPPIQPVDQSGACIPLLTRKPSDSSTKSEKVVPNGTESTRVGCRDTSNNNRPFQSARGAAERHDGATAPVPVVRFKSFRSCTIPAPHVISPGQGLERRAARAGGARIDVSISAQQRSALSRRRAPPRPSAPHGCRNACGAAMPRMLNAAMPEDVSVAGQQNISRSRPPDRAQRVAPSGRSANHKACAATLWLAPNSP